MYVKDAPHAHGASATVAGTSKGLSWIARSACWSSTTRRTSARSSRRCCRAVPSIEVVGTARDGEEALEQVERLQPDVVTCDLIMPGMDGVEFIQRQMAMRPVPIVDRQHRRRSRASAC